MMFTSNPVSKSLLDAVNGIMQEEKEEKKESSKPESKEKDEGESEKHEKGESKKHEKEEKEKGEKAEKVEEGVLDTVKSAVKTGAKAVIKGAVKGAKALGGPDDEGHRKDLQRKLGVPQTGRKPMATYNEGSAQFTLKDRLIEREMTKGEKEDREDIVQGMKKNTEYFKKKYGSRWEKVMNATATKNAMKEQIEEHTTDTLEGRVAGGESNDFKSFKSRLLGRGEVTAPNKEEPSNSNKASIAGKGGQVPSPKIGVAEEYDEAVVAELLEFMQTEEFEQLDELKKSTLASYINKAAQSRVSTAHASRSLSDKGVAAGGPQNVPGYDDKSLELMNKDTKRAIGIHKATSKLAKESWDDMLKSVKEKGEKKPNGGSGIKTGTRYGGGKQTKDEDEKKKVTEGKDPNMDVGAGAAPNFVQDANTTSNPVLNRIRDVTKGAMSKIKTEMLGKAPGNN